MIVTIDGPAGSGKSTTARLLAERLGFGFLDTGAMYRAVALKCIEQGIDLNDDDAVARLAEKTQIDALGSVVQCDGRDVTSAIRTAEVSSAASRVAANPGVRTALVAMQRAVGSGRRIVTEGRDQGTVVFPDAECKFFLTAQPEERARRRQLELQTQGAHVPIGELLTQIHERDTRDQTREVSPLRPAADAQLIDTSQLSSDEVVEMLEAAVRRRMSK